MSDTSDASIHSFKGFSSSAADASGGLIQLTTVAVFQASSGKFPRRSSCDPRLRGVSHSGIQWYSFPNFLKAVEGMLLLSKPSRFGHHSVRHGTMKVEGHQCIQQQYYPTTSIDDRDPEPSWIKPFIRRLFHCEILVEVCDWRRSWVATRLVVIECS